MSKHIVLDEQLSAWDTAGDHLIVAADKLAERYPARSEVEALAVEDWTVFMF